MKTMDFTRVKFKQIILMLFKCFVDISKLCSDSSRCEQNNSKKNYLKNSKSQKIMMCQT